MKKITAAIFAAMMAFSAVLSVSAPVYAEEKCPAGTLQADKARYKTEDSEKITDLKTVGADNEGHFTGNPLLSSLSQCNLDARNVAGKQLMDTSNQIINVILGVIGIVAVAVIIIGGVMYTTSAGDPGKVKKAKDAILYGIIGLLIALLAFAIVNFILSGVFGS